jgi:heme-transporting ATPase
MLRFENVTKRYDDTVVFTGLSQRFDAGCFALHGDHGEGKSTLITILAGVLSADTGDVWIKGHSLRHSPDNGKAALAYVPDDSLLYPDMTGRELLERAASERQTAIHQETFDLAERFGLTSRLDMRFDQMSTGTRKKFFLTAISVGAPAVVLADEPTIGLDRPSWHLLVQFFKTLSKDRVVLFATHDPDFVSACEARIIGFDELRTPPPAMSENRPSPQS